VLQERVIENDSDPSEGPQTFRFEDLQAL